MLYSSITPYQFLIGSSGIFEKPRLKRRQNRVVSDFAFEMTAIIEWWMAEGLAERPRKALGL
jgi:hypothetical protein